MRDEINSFDENRILNTSEDDLCNYFVKKYKVEALQIDESQIQSDTNRLRRRSDQCKGLRTSYLSNGNQSHVLHTVQWRSRSIQATTIHVQRQPATGKSERS